MFPVFFEFGPLVIRGYGVMLALAFLLGIYLALERAHRRGLNQDHMVNLCLLIIVSSIVGARVLYVVPHWYEFRAHPLDIISPFQSSGGIGITGLTMYGGFIGGIAASVWYLRRKRLPVWKTTDAFAPSIALGIGITRLGCFFNGCCFGMPTDAAWGMVFPINSAAGAMFPDTPLHPAQLYSALLGFTLFGALMVLGRRERYDGYLFSMLLILEPVTRFTVDFFRYYESSMTIAAIDGVSLSLNQGISIALCGAGLFLFFRLKEEAHRRRVRRPARRRRTAEAGKS